jgi:uncharacterized protein
MWHNDTPSYPIMTNTYRHRDLAPTVGRALANMPVVVVCGMRQVGKSTLLQRDPVCKGRRYLSLDDFATLDAARRNPEALLAGTGPLTIDEAQRCPELLVAIKREVDRDRRPGRFLLSGSASFDLLHEVVESLAGRAIYLTLSPFTRRELAGRMNDQPFVVRFARDPSANLLTRHSGTVRREEILLGGMPSVCLGETVEPRFWFTGFEQTYLERDVRNLAQVADLVAFRQLLGLTALRTAQLLNVSEIARDAKLTAVTATRYLGLLEASFVIRRIGPFLGNRASRLIKSPKIYLTDSGLAAHLISAGERLPDAAWGAVTETYLAQNLLGILEARWPEARLHFWNVQGRHEVDFVIEAGKTVVAIEVKSSARWSDRDLVGLRAFLEATPECRAAVLTYGGSQAVSLGDRLWAIPMGMLLS